MCRQLAWWIVGLWLVALGAACGDESSGTAGGGTESDSGEIPYATLAEYGLFTGSGEAMAPASGVIPYGVNAPLFSDYTAKFRFIAVPPGETITYHDDESWEYPVGTIAVKTFSYAHDIRDPAQGYQLLETRLLIRDEAGWNPYTYVWNEDASEAELTLTGAVVSASWIDADGEAQALDYRVPNVNQCRRCHGEPGENSLLGHHTRQLNRDNAYGGETVNQIDYLASHDLFSAPPPGEADRARFPSPYDDDLDAEPRARAWLDANCHHCHNPTGSASSTGLYLGWHVTEPIDFGVCRQPFAAGTGTGGRLFDIVPGEPDESILVFRIESTEPGIQMPELPNQLIDEQAIAVVRQWIEEMTDEPCVTE